MQTDEKTHFLVVTFSAFVYNGYKLIVLSFSVNMIHKGECSPW